MLSLALLPIVIFGEMAEPERTQPAEQQIEMRVLSTYSSGITDDSAAEIVAYDPMSQRLFVTNASEESIDVISIKDPSQPNKVNHIDLKPYGSPNSVAVKEGIVAVAVEASIKQGIGSVVMFDTKGKYQNQLAVGSLPDMLTFTPNGASILVANEGQPNKRYTRDPEGSISVIKLSKPIQKMTQAAVTTINFNEFDNKDLDDSIRIFGPNASVSQDLEPEYITVSKDSKTAWVTLQENNAIAIVDLQKQTVTKLVGLGVKAFDANKNAMDASDKDKAINIKPWPVKAYYQPDTIASYEYHGDTYLVTANEGDARDYDGFSEQERVRDLNLDGSITNKHPKIQKKKRLGRLKVTSIDGDVDQDGDIDQLYTFGARSFSIWNSTGKMVFDSGADFARITALAGPAIFNANDKRSDNKGSEPEVVTIGKIAERTYAFIGLERTGGIMLYDVSNPNAPTFVQYINNFNPEGDLDSGTAGDVAPEGMVFIPAKQSPSKTPLLVVTNEVSGTTTLYEIASRSEKHPQRALIFKLTKSL